MLGRIALGTGGLRQRDSGRDKGKGVAVPSMLLLSHPTAERISSLYLWSHAVRDHTLPYNTALEAHAETACARACQRRRRNLRGYMLICRQIRGTRGKSREDQSQRRAPEPRDRTSAGVARMLDPMRAAVGTGTGAGALPPEPRVVSFDHQRLNQRLRSPTGFPVTHALIHCQSL